MKNNGVYITKGTKGGNVATGSNVAKGSNITKGCNVAKGCNVTCLHDFM